LQLQGSKLILFLKNFLFTVFVPGTFAVWIPYILTKNETVVFGMLKFVAIVVFVIGGAIYFWCVWDFAAFGRGTPAPIDAPKKLVVRGLYRYSRNPMYVGVLTVICGWSILFRSVNVLLYALVVAIAFNIFIRIYEEPHLRNIFGREYDEYCRTVARWFPIR
jgi:protein-S-isoprenylcysteine O-methyltransferase Ste14